MLFRNHSLLYNVKQKKENTDLFSDYMCADACLAKVAVHEVRAFLLIDLPIVYVGPSIRN